MRIFGFILILLLGVANLVSSRYLTLRFVVLFGTKEVYDDGAWHRRWIDGSHLST